MAKNVTSKVTLNKRRIKQLTDAQVRALIATAEYVHNEVVQAQVVPRRDGELQGEGFYVDTSKSKQGTVSLVHATPYARRMYYHPEYNFHKEPWEETIHHRDGSVSHLKHDGNPNAKGKWLEDWMEGGKEYNKVQEAYQRYYKKEADV